MSGFDPMLDFLSLFEKRAERVKRSRYHERSVTTWAGAVDGRSAVIRFEEKRPRGDSFLTSSNARMGQKAGRSRVNTYLDGEVVGGALAPVELHALAASVVRSSGMPVRLAMRGHKAPLLVTGTESFESEAYAPVSAAAAQEAAGEPGPAPLFDGIRDNRGATNDEREAVAAIIPELFDALGQKAGEGANPLEVAAIEAALSKLASSTVGHDHKLYLRLRAARSRAFEPDKPPVPTFSVADATSLVRELEEEWTARRGRTADPIPTDPHRLAVRVMEAYHFGTWEAEDASREATSARVKAFLASGGVPFASHYHPDGWAEMARWLLALGPSEYPPEPKRSRDGLYTKKQFGAEVTNPRPSVLNVGVLWGAAWAALAKGRVPGKHGSDRPLGNPFRNATDSTRSFGDRLRFDATHLWRKGNGPHPRGIDALANRVHEEELWGKIEGAIRVGEYLLSDHLHDPSVDLDVKMADIRTLHAWPGGYASDAFEETLSKTHDIRLPSHVRARAKRSGEDGLPTFYDVLRGTVSLSDAAEQARARRESNERERNKRREGHQVEYHAAFVRLYDWFREYVASGRSLRLSTVARYANTTYDVRVGRSDYSGALTARVHGAGYLWHVPWSNTHPARATAAVIDAGYDDLHGIALHIARTMSELPPKAERTGTDWFDKARRTAERKARQDFEAAVPLRLAFGLPVDDEPEAQKERKPLSLPRQSFAMGGFTTVQFAADGSISEEGVYVVDSVDRLHASHTPDCTPNPKHTIAGAQPRDRSTKELCRQSEAIARKLSPSIIASQAPEAFSGPPVANLGGEVIQGNGRAIALRIMYERYPERAAQYQAHLVEHAEAFGLNPDQVRSVPQPVLYRALRVSDDRAVELGNVLNTAEAEQAPLDLAKALVRRLSDERRRELREFVQKLTEASDGETLRSAFDGAGAAHVLDFFDGLPRAGLVTGGALTTRGKDLFTDVLMAVVFDDPGEANATTARVSAIPHTARRGIERGIGHLVSFVGTPYDLSPRFRAAAEILRRIEQSEGALTRAADVLRQTDAFSTEAFTEADAALADVLRTAKSQRDVSARLSSYARMARGYTTLFEEVAPLEPEAAFQAAILEGRRPNPAPLAPLVDLGLVDRLDVAEADGVMTYEDTRGGTLMLWAPSLHRLLLVPVDRTERTTTAPANTEAEERYEEWSHDEADGYDLAVDLPEEALSPELECTTCARLGLGVAIWYASDKLMRPGDRRGVLNGYHHDFDADARPVYALDYPDGGVPVLAIGDLNIDGRGILN